MQLLIRLAALAGTLILLATVLPGIHVKSKKTAVTVSVVFGILHLFLGWLIAVLLVVPAVLTLGLLFLVYPFAINTVLLWLTDLCIADFEIKNLKTLLLTSGAITLVNAVVLVVLAVLG